MVQTGTMPVCTKQNLQQESELELEQKSEQELEQKSEQESELELEQKSEQKADLEVELKVKLKTGKTVVQKQPPDQLAKGNSDGQSVMESAQAPTTPLRALLAGGGVHEQLPPLPPPRLPAEGGACG